MHQLWNGITQNYKNRFWWNLAEVFKTLQKRLEFTCFRFHVGLLSVTSHQNPGPYEGGRFDWFDRTPSAASSTCIHVTVHCGPSSKLPNISVKIQMSHFKWKSPKIFWRGVTIPSPEPSPVRGPRQPPAIYCNCRGPSSKLPNITV